MSSSTPDRPPRKGPYAVGDDDVTNALLRQTVEDLRRSVDELRKTVGDYNVLQHRVSEVEKDLKDLTSRKANDRRLVLVAFVAPTVLWLLQLYVTSRGGV